MISARSFKNEGVPCIILMSLDMEKKRVKEWFSSSEIQFIIVFTMGMNGVSSGITIRGMPFESAKSMII